MVPGEELFFMGSKTRSDYISHNVLTQETVVDIWQKLGWSTRELQRMLVNSIRDENKIQAQEEEKRLKSFGLHTTRDNEVVLINTSAAELKLADSVQFREDEYGPEREEEYHRGLQQGFDHGSRGQLQREWNEYATYIREQQRKRKEIESAMLEETHKTDISTLGVRNCPSAEAQVKLKILHEKEAAIQAREKAEAEMREYANSLEMLEQTTSVESEQVQPNPFLFLKAATTKPGTQIILNYKSKLAGLMPKLKPNILLKHTPKPANTTWVEFPEFDVSSFNSVPLAPTQDADEEQQLQDAIALSKKSYRDHIRREFIQQAQAAYISVTQSLAEHGFSSMRQYLDADLGGSPLAKPTTSIVPSGPAQEDLQTFQNILRNAYTEGSKARARLENMTWAEYTRLEKDLDPKAYLTLMVSETPVTVDDMPPRTTPSMSSGTVAVQRTIWEWLCGIIIEANDFEAQTRAADLPSETYTSVDGQRYAVI